MNIFITGGTGFVGTRLVRGFIADGHSVTATGTRPRADAVRHENFHYISADTSRPGPWQEAAAEAEAVINLAGRTIFSYWTEKYKKELYDSRILTTRHLVDALPAESRAVLCSTSAVGYYGHTGDAEITESAPAADDFLGKLAGDWEAEALRAADKGCRVARMRFGVILGTEGGALKKMLPAFRCGAGGPLGNGRQWFPWIHIDDVIDAVRFIISHDRVEGPLNFTAPEPVRQGEFAKILGRRVRRPAFLPAPGLMIRLIMGEMGGVLLEGQRALPDGLHRAGFIFKYPKVSSALSELII